jgi:hypothetical protein
MACGNEWRKEAQNTFLDTRLKLAQAELRKRLSRFAMVQALRSGGENPQITRRDAGRTEPHFNLSTEPAAFEQLAT